MRTFDRPNLRKRAAARDSGMTLVETLVALSLFAVGAAAVGNLLTQQTRLASSNNVTSKAYSLAEQELEEMRALDYADQTSRSRSYTMGNIVYTVGTKVETNVPSANMKRITVDVDWTDQTGPRNVALYTIYTAIKR